MRKFAAPVTLLLFILALFTPITDNSFRPASRIVSSDARDAQSYANGSILFDESHCARGSDMWTPGNASVFSALLEEHGYTSSTNWDIALDSGILSDFDILCIFFPQEEFSVGEVAAVHDFVSSGGNLLLVGVGQDLCWEYTVQFLNSLSEPYNIIFNEDKWLGKCLESEGDLVDHQINYDVASIHSSCDQLRGCTLEVTSPVSVVATFEESPVVAYCESGNGKVVASGTLAPFIQYRHDNNWRVEWDDHYQFSLNIIDWLVTNPPRQVNVPDKLFIRTGAGPELTQSEIEEYQVFSGVYHDHTTKSDGYDAPDVMVNRALETALDFFVIADHSYDIPADNGIVGAQTARRYQQKYGLDCPIFVGAELSSMPHTVGFPLTENIFTRSIQTAISEIHAQNALAILAHPTIGSSYIDPWVNFTTYGYDAFEVDCRNYFHAQGESCYSIPFCASCDGHAYSNLALVQNIAFVNNPTGPNGAISADDFKEAILDFRVVVVDLVNMVVIGQGVWVDRFIELWELAEAAIADCDTLLQGIEDSGTAIGYARLYLNAAESALKWWNPSRGLRLVAEASSDFVLGLDIAFNTPNLGVIEPENPTTLSLTIMNRNPYPITFNITPYIVWALTLEKVPHVMEVAGSTNATLNLTSNAASFGYGRITLNIQSSNSSGIHTPLSYTLGGIIRNIDVVSERGEISIRLLRNRADHRLMSSAILHHDNGSGEAITRMGSLGDCYGITLGPFSTTVTISFFIVVTDILGNNFTLPGGTYLVPTDSSVPEFTGALEEIILSAIIGGFAITALILVLFVSKRRKGS
ncbi:MAG: hypothetical protein RTU92_09285 [Candidatus Thorarchaeota archaeon]